MNSVKGDFFFFFFSKEELGCIEDFFPSLAGQKENLSCVCIGIARQQEVKVGSAAIAFFSVFYLTCIVFIPCLVGTAPILVSDCVD